MDTQTSLRIKVEKEVLEQLLSDLVADKIDLEKAREIARETLVKIDEIEKHEESVMQFYENLSKKHEPFKMLYTKVKGDILRGREVNAYRSALMAIHSGDVGSAQNIAKGALATTANETANT